MQKQINKLKKLGMTPKAAMLFVRTIADQWYDCGYVCGSNDQNLIEVEDWNTSQSASFDTQFHESLTD
jgi:hypothetical protein